MSERKRTRSVTEEAKKADKAPGRATIPSPTSSTASSSSSSGTESGDQSARTTRNGKRPLLQADEDEEEEGVAKGKQSDAEEGENDEALERQYTQTQNRKKAMKKVAESRAAHFARADANDRLRSRPAAGGRSARSTTPLPVVHKPSGPSGEQQPQQEQEQWPGPFSTARQMIRERDAAAAARQERLANGQVLEEGEEEGEMEKIKKFKIDWQPRASKRPPPPSEVPSLGSICLGLLIKHVDAIESLGCVTTQVRYQFAEALAREGKLTSEAVQRLIDPGLVEFFLPDCKHLDQASLIAALETVAKPPASYDEADDEAAGAPPMDVSSTGECGLRILRLRWCGRGFGSQAAEALVRLGVSKRLEALELGGLYHLTDAALTKLLSACERLTSLDLPYKSIVSGACLRAVAANTTITSLSIAHSPQVDLEAVQSLQALKRMKRLDLSGLHITDEVLEEVLKGNGATLTSLSLNQCQQLTDKALELISTHCKTLSRLDMGGIHNLTCESLLAFFSTSACARGLEEVALGRLDHSINDDVVVALTALCGKSLRRLDLNSANEVTDVSLAALAKFSPAVLAEVDLSFCRKITDDGLGHMADSCPALKRLALWGCTQVTDRFLKGHSRVGLVVVGRTGNNKKATGLQTR